MFYKKRIEELECDVRYLKNQLSRREDEHNRLVNRVQRILEYMNVEECVIMKTYLREKGGPEEA